MSFFYGHARDRSYRYAPEFTSIPTYQPALAVTAPYTLMADGSYLQLEYRCGECIPYAIARYYTPASENTTASVFVCGRCGDPDRTGHCHNPACPERVGATARADWEVSRGQA